LPFGTQPRARGKCTQPDADPAETTGRARVASGLRCRASERSSKGLETSRRKEHAMMFAFALALVGIAVLGSLNLIAAHGH
jgi:hypothetical protein